MSVTIESSDGICWEVPRSGAEKSSVVAVALENCKDRFVRVPVSSERMSAVVQFMRNDPPALTNMKEVLKALGAADVLDCSVLLDAACRAVSRIVWGSGESDYSWAPLLTRGMETRIRKVTDHRTLVAWRNRSAQLESERLALRKAQASGCVVLLRAGNSSRKRGGTWAQSAGRRYIPAVSENCFGYDVFRRDGDSLVHVHTMEVEKCTVFHTFIESVGGGRVATLATSKSLAVWDALSGRTVDAISVGGHPSVVRHVGGNRVAAGVRHSGLLELHEIGSGDRKKLVGHTAQVTGIEMLSCGGRIVTTADDHLVGVWDLVTLERIRWMYYPGGNIRMPELVTINDGAFACLWPCGHVSVWSLGDDYVETLGQASPLVEAGYGRLNFRRLVLRDGVIRTETIGSVPYDSKPRNASMLVGQNDETVVAFPAGRGVSVYVLHPTREAVKIDTTVFIPDEPMHVTVL